MKKKDGLTKKEIDLGYKRYNCKENDNHVKFSFVDGNLDEMLFGDCLERSWLVIGLDDLVGALDSVGYEIKKQ